MQLTHVSTNLRQGLRRNLSMHVAVVLTLFVSLSLAGVGLLLDMESGKITDQFGSQLTLTVYLCADDDVTNASCTSAATDEQRQTVLAAIQSNPEVVGEPAYVSQQESLDKMRAQIGPQPFEGRNPIVTVNKVPSYYVVTLQDPKQYAGVVSQVSGLPGVSGTLSAATLVGPIFTLLDNLRDGSLIVALLLVIAAVLLVANTIRLAALARRKEIEIMRLVGASRIFIALPFVLEALVTALIGAALACGALAAFVEFAIKRGLAVNTKAVPFIGWSQYGTAAIYVVVGSLVLTIIPTLLTTRKYLRI